MTQHGKVTVQLSSSFERALDLSTVRDALATEYAWPFADGTGASQADQLWHDRRTLAAGASETLSLTDGSLADAFGQAVVLAGVKVLAVKAATDNLADLVISIPVAAGLGSPAVGDQVVSLPPGAALVLVAPGEDGSPIVPGWAVSAGTWDAVRVENLDPVDDATYEIVILGVGA